MNEAGFASAARDMQVRAAWLYYIEGLTQEEIARTMRISRAKVVRLLVAARHEGVVRIEIGGRGGDLVSLERALVARFGLAEAMVTPACADERDVAALVGHAAGTYLRSQLRDGLVLAAGWGATLTMAVPALEGAAPVEGIAVVSLLGGMTHSRAVNPAAVARRMADALHAECYQLTAPLIVADEPTREALWREPGLTELRERARRADIALVSVGDVSPQATLFREAVLPGSYLDSLAAAAAVGDLLCTFLDAHGNAVDHPVNRRVMAVPLDDVRRIPSVVIASGGARKVGPLRAALQAVPARVLVTDATAAAGLLER
ncbi:MAG TPA: sugar-binding transcriptional regulator [Casimicrobiaceae bacterium]|jgi:DNA-binding transcriptional regulator LsrR (DeoR family)